MDSVVTILEVEDSVVAPVGSDVGASVVLAALSNVAKCVRWVHSHTVLELLERLPFLEHPLVASVPTFNKLL